MKKYLIIAAIFGCLAVVLGAFGAHALKSVLSDAQLTSYETAVRYQMYHAIVLLCVNSYSKFSVKEMKNISLLFIAGIVLFSGSIYAIVFGIPAKSIWFVTPIGGVLLIIGWLLMLLYIIRNK